jgi:hypothetical protein
LSFRSVSFVIPEGNLRLHAACHPAAFRLSFRSASFVIPQRSEGICVCTLLVIPQRFVCRSAAPRLSFRSAAKESAFASLPHYPIQPVISTEAGHASSSCAAEKPLYLRILNQPGKIPRDLRTP